jgi:hypothetical protein
MEGIADSDSGRFCRLIVGSEIEGSADAASRLGRSAEMHMDKSSDLHTNKIVQKMNNAVAVSQRISILLVLRPQRVRSPRFGSRSQRPESKLSRGGRVAIYISVKAYGTMKPRSCTNEDPSDEPLRSVVANAAQE